MSQIKILVVDDESRMRKLVKDFLIRKDYAVLEAANGEEAVDVFIEKSAHCPSYIGCYDAKDGRLAGM